MAAYSAAVTLNMSIGSFLKHRDVLLPPVGLKAFQFASKELNSFKMFLQGLDSRSRKRMKASLARIAATITGYGDLAFRPEDGVPNYEECEEISRRVDSMVEEMNKVKEEYYRLPVEEEDASSSRVVSKSKIVGLRDERRYFKENIVNSWNPYSLLSHPGMAGIGKTTLAREFFEDLDISEWFECRAWVTVGCEWNSKEITETILTQIGPAQVDHEGYTTMVMVERLKECLKGKRYLIVLDDVWHMRVHRYRKIVFPDNQNGSRVIITSRSRYVARSVHENSVWMEMRLLDKEESWDLLREKVFAGDSCPAHLEDAGKKIAEKCDGLPLTILTVADLLSKADEAFWIDAAIKKKHQLYIDAYAQISQVLYPSYKVLPADVKLCLLYMSAFPLKYEIRKVRLFDLWIVEKLIEKRLDRSLGFSAYEIFQGLYDDFLIMVYQGAITSFKHASNAQIKTFGLHSSWWHFCQIEAKNANFFHVLDSYDKDSLEKAIEGQSRLSFHTNVLFSLKHVHNSIEEICASSAQSLLCFGPYSQYMVPVCFGLKFLLRLNALNIRFYDFPLEVLGLVMLKYLALTCNRNLPPTISILQKLQYLIVQPHSSIKSDADQPNLPVEIWDMKRLKHLRVVGRDLPDLGDTSLEELKTLSGVTTRSCTILDWVPNITKLGIKIELTPDAAEPLCYFDHVSHLAMLSILACVIVNPVRKFEVVAPFPCLPHSLLKLNLNGLGYPWKEMSKIASLPNLQALKLQYNAFQGPEWEVEENGFPQLQSLVIRDMDLVKLRWAPGSFKSLQVLKIHHCYKLEELHLGHSQEIYEIDLVDCNHWVEWYVKYNALDFTLYTINMHSSWKNNERQLE